MVSGRQTADWSAVGRQLELIATLFCTALITLASELKIQEPQLHPQTPTANTRPTSGYYTSATDAMAARDTYSNARHHP